MKIETNKMIKPVYFMIGCILIMMISTLSLWVWDRPRIEKTKETCKEICGGMSYDCRNKCFSYEYSK